MIIPSRFANELVAIGERSKADVIPLIDTELRAVFAPGVGGGDEGRDVKM